MQKKMIIIFLILMMFFSSFKNKKINTHKKKLDFNNQYYYNVDYKKLKNFFKKFGAKKMLPEINNFIYFSQKYHLPIQLLPSIVMVESSGGKYEFKRKNPFGFRQKKFKSYRDAIYTVAKTFATHEWYKNKSLKEKLYLYNDKDTNYFKNISFFMKEIDSNSMIF